MALALEGATIPSSNTDGIYVFDIELDKNTAIVNRELKELYIEIDPEPMYLVSKDTNNRMESEDGKITSASGATLSAWNGANVDSRLAHPAISDKVLTIYLQDDTLLDGPVDNARIREAIDQYHDNIDVLKEFEHYKDAKKRTFVYMSSWVMRSTSGSLMVDDDGKVHDGTIRTWLTKEGTSLSRYTTKKDKPSKRLNEYAEKLFPDTRLGEPNLITHLTHIGVYDNYFKDAITVKDYLGYCAHVKSTGEKPASVPVIAKSKISNLPENARVTINNKSLLKMSEEEIDHIYQNINFDYYTELIANKATNWHNVLKAS